MDQLSQKNRSYAGDVRTKYHSYTDVRGIGWNISHIFLRQKTSGLFETCSSINCFIPNGRLKQRSNLKSWLLTHNVLSTQTGTAPNSPQQRCAVKRWANFFHVSTNQLRRNNKGTQQQKQTQHDLRSTLEDPAELQRQCEQQQHERLNEAGCLDGFKAHQNFRVMDIYLKGTMTRYG